MHCVSSDYRRCNLYISDHSFFNVVDGVRVGVGIGTTQASAKEEAARLALQALKGS